MAKEKMIDPENRFGKMMLRRRLALGLTQAQLASSIGHQPNYMVYLEKGERRPSLHVLDKIIQALQLDPAEAYLAAHPKAAKYLKLNKAKEIDLDLPVGLQELSDDTELCQQHGITDEMIASAATWPVEAGAIVDKNTWFTSILVTKRVIPTRPLAVAVAS